jgi:hypothetical protein
MFSDAMIGVPLPFEKGLCGQLRLQRWGLDACGGWEECEILGGQMV